MFENEKDVAVSEEVEVITPQESSEDLGVHQSETTEPTSDGSEVATEDSRSEKSKADSAFAEMRRARQEAENRARELEEEFNTYKAQQEARAKVISQLSDGKEDAELEALAYSLGIEVEDVLEAIEAENESARLRTELEALKAEKEEVETQRALDNALSEINKLDSNLSEDEIGAILGYADAGLSIEDGYYAVKAKEIATKATPPKEIGKLNSNKPMEKEFFTKAEVDAMTENEIRKYADKILSSSAKW